MQVFIEYSNDIDEIYENIEYYKRNKKQKILYLMIWLLIYIVIKNLSNSNWIIYYGVKVKYFLCFYRKILFPVLENIWLNSTRYFVMNILNKRELQQIALNHSSDIDFQNLMNLYKKCTGKPYSFLVIDTLASDNYSRCRKNLLEII